MTAEINNYPTADECEKLWEQYHTPPHVIRHCIGVTNVAVKIAEALNENGYFLNVPLIRSAGLLHDLLRVEEEHGEHAAAVIEGLGYQDVAEIVHVHMKYQIPSTIEQLSEKDLVCLGDRVVLEDRFVGLDQRMEYIIKKSERKGNIGVETRIRASFSNIRTFVEGIEAVVGKSLEDIMK